MDRRCLVIGFLASVFMFGTALAINYEKDEDENINQWYSSVKTNNNSSCCGLGDAYWADNIEIITGVDYFFATITDDRQIKGRPDFNGMRIKVPYAALDRKKQGNPTGHNIIFVKPSSGEGSSLIDSLVKPVSNKDYWDEEDVTIYCFFPDQGI